MFTLPPSNEPTLEEVNRMCRQADSMVNRPRFYNMPTSAVYGPCRRLHVMLMQLTADMPYEAADRLYAAHFDETWDCTLADQLRFGKSEAEAQRHVLDEILWLIHRRA